MSSLSSWCDPDQHSSRVWIPVRRCKSGERRYKTDTGCIRNRFREFSRLLRIGNKMHLVLHPCDDGTCNIDSSVQSEYHVFSMHFPADACKKSCIGINRCFSCVHQHEASGSICRFDHSLAQTGLSKQGRLLVHHISGNQDLSFFSVTPPQCGISIFFCAVSDLRKNALRNFQKLQQFVIPFIRMDIEKCGP